ncbi:MAG: alanine racemase [Verrucomicrobiota bacterium]
MSLHSAGFPLRPAWVEIDLAQLRQNLRLIRRDLPSAVKLLAVVKDEAYGHGALEVAQIALEEGAAGFGLSTLEEAMTLRDAGMSAPLLLLGERQEAELPWCVEHDLTVCVNEPHTIRQLARAAAAAGKRVPVHLKIHTGMSRYGVRWDEAVPLLEMIEAEKSLRLEGVMTHFAQSDEADKSFALLQISRFDEVMGAWRRASRPLPWQHLCNSGGFLDLPQAHRDMVRVGILLYGVFPSTVCRRIAGIQPVMSVKARIAAIQRLNPGEVAGYGMRYAAPSPRRLAVLPIGYGDGFPRVRNAGGALIRGRRAPLVGGVAMDAITVDITGIAGAQMWDEAVIMGRQGGEEISVHDIARLKNSVSYDVLTSWRLRLRRKSVNGQVKARPVEAVAALA